MSPVCVVCGASFSARTVKQVACSDVCRQRRAKAQREAWHKAHKYELCKYWTKYHQMHRERRNAASLARYHAKKK